MKTPCLEAECAIWAGDRCAIVGLAICSPAISSPVQTAVMGAEELLRRCAAALGRTSVTLLRRREIDDFLASSHIVLDATQRRTLFRTWRDIRRLAREEYLSSPGEWRMQQSNQGSPWSDDEDAQLKQSYAAGLPISRIAANHKRSEGAIRSRLEKHGLLADDNGSH
jgi:hypothetical protein